MNRLHPISAVYRGFGFGVSIGTFGGLAGFGLTIFVEWDLSFLFPVLLAILGFGIGAAIGVAQYYRFAYDVTGGTLSIQSGVFDRQERDIPLGRIQNVDIRRNLVNRILGLAVVQFETAGGSSTEGVISVVTLEEARRLQDAVARGQREDGTDDSAAGVDESAERARVVDSDPDEAKQGTDTEEAIGRETRQEETTQPRETAGAKADEEELFTLSSSELFVFSMVSFRPSAPLLVIFGVPILDDVAFRLFSRSLLAIGGPEIGSVGDLFRLPPLEVLLVVFIGGLQLFLVTWVTSALLTANGYYDFRLTRVGNDLRYERGFLQRYSGTIPLDKVQTVTIKENVLMRRFGYGSLLLETAGYGPGQSGDAANMAVPLDERETVFEMANELGHAKLPDVNRPPRRARRRYAVRFSLVVLALAAGLFAVDTYVFAHPWWLAFVGLVVTPLAGHYRWRHRGHALADDAFVAREGFWRRQTRFVPYYRIQTAIDERTVFQRWRNLASVTADTASTASIVGGDATAHDVDEATAQSLHPTLLERLQTDLREMRSETDETGVAGAD